MREGWRETTLGEVVEVNPESMSTSSAPATFRYVDLSSVTPTSGIDEIELASYSLETAPGRARRIIRRGDVLVSTVRPYLRGFGYVSSSLDGEVASTGFCVLRAIPAIIESGLIWALVRTPDFVGHLMTRATGSNYPAVRSPDVASFPVLLPPLDEQRRIVDLIAAVDEAIEATEGVNSASDQARRGLLGELLSEERARREGWRETTLGEVAEVIGGGTPRTSTPDFWGGEIVWLTPTEVAAAEGTVIADSRRTITRIGLNASGAKLLPANSVLLTSRATVGAVAMAGCELSTNQGFQSLLAGDDVLPWFLLFWVQHNKAEFTRRASGSTFPEISRSEVRRIPVLLPPLDEQRRIVDIVSAADEQASTADSLANTFRSLRSALLADLLSGDHEIPASYDELLSV